MEQTSKKCTNRKLERVIHSQLVTYLSENSILNSKQHGFRPGKSTSTAIFEMLKSLYENWSQKFVSIYIYILISLEPLTVSIM